MKMSLQSKIVVGFWAAILTLGAVGGASISNVVRIIAQTSRSSQNREAIAELNRLWGLVAAADAAARHHVLTETPESLVAYRAARAEVRTSLEMLRQTVRKRASSRLRTLH